jgi:hypothetical protein
VRFRHDDLWSEKLVERPDAFGGGH